MPEEQNENKAVKLWVTLDDCCIQDNEAGLNLLRRAIDEALEKGEESIEENGVLFSGIARRDENRDFEIEKETKRVKYFGWGFTVIIVFFLFVFIFGLTQIPSLFK